MNGMCVRARVCVREMQREKRVKEGSSTASLIKVNSQGRPWEEIKTSKL